MFVTLRKPAAKNFLIFGWTPTLPRSTKRSVLGLISVRLAGVRHAASVRPEPGSNSLKYAIKTRFRVLIYLRAFEVLILTFANVLSFFRVDFSFPEVPFSSLHFPNVFSNSFTSSFLSFSRCLIFKVLCALRSLFVKCCVSSAHISYQTFPLLSTLF